MKTWMKKLYSSTMSANYGILLRAIFILMFGTPYTDCSQLSKHSINGLNSNVPEKFENALRLLLLNPDTNLSTPDMIRNAGYPVEEHHVTTEDGYLLTVHRIPGKENSSPVLLQHGLLGSSADWVIPGRNKALAYILADKGYDVWLGNARGNTYSRFHKSIPSTDARFWDFSWHEMGIYDLPAVIFYIWNLKRDTVIYIGHSMGTTMFYVMASQFPNTNNYVRAMFSLAPVAFMNHLKSPIRIIAPFADDLEWISRYLGKGEFLPQNKLLKFLAKFGCELDTVEEKICANSLFILCGFDEKQFNVTLLPIILGHTPAGTSTKTLVHFSQEIKSGKFQHYDYGPALNEKVYNSTTPPEYNLSNVQVPIALFNADNDWLASPIDVDRLRVRLPNVILRYKVNYPKFNHLDFLWGIDAPKLVYQMLLSAISKLDRVKILE